MEVPRLSRVLGAVALATSLAGAFAPSSGASAFLNKKVQYDKRGLESFSVPSASMEPTLLPGDTVLVQKQGEGSRALGIGDIVVFRRPPNDAAKGVKDLIKRVVALPRQTVSVANCRLYVDGSELAQPYLPSGWQDKSSEYCTGWPSEGCSGKCLSDPYKVPAGSLFVLGDNRGDSCDSRYWGALPLGLVVGRVVEIVRKGRVATLR
jgi:signal peptidase I